MTRGTEKQQEGHRRELAAELSWTLPRCPSVLSKHVLPLSQGSLCTHLSHITAPRVSQPSAFSSDITMQSQSTCPHLKENHQQKHLPAEMASPFECVSDRVATEAQPSTHWQTRLLSRELKPSKGASAASLPACEGWALPAPAHDVSHCKVASEPANVLPCKWLMSYQAKSHPDFFLPRRKVPSTSRESTFCQERKTSEVRAGSEATLCPVAAFSLVFLGKPAP